MIVNKRKVSLENMLVKRECAVIEEYTLIGIVVKENIMIMIIMLI